ncbi:MAG TPA: LamG-like jellyroll fold domain-containing protein, partial [Anaerolineae bacterium]|nr:LamG-like jellyroll fold domain-containing protein [Anaerolineae bacterium]
MKRIFHNHRHIPIQIILLVCSGIVYQTLDAQQLHEPEAGYMAGQADKYSVSKEPGLLFYLSGEKDFNADFSAGGQVSPNFLKDVSIISGGACGKGFKAEDTQLMTYWAPGNIYAQRGTLSFFWRSRYPVGPTPFPVFRVGYADHSSWDMVWLRIDYNGSGFDAFITDIGLSRTRISWYTDKFPAPDIWMHVALSWDETEGIRFYVNGKLVARQTVNGSVYDSGLDQFGPHSRIISPYQVQSAYSFSRGGDVDEIRIYDRMLPDDSIEELASGNGVKNLPPFKRDLAEQRWRDEWWIRNGWNLPNSPPPLLPSSETSVRKVEIHDAYDIKRWYWKANDGIRETTWPGVYNMSRLPGRYDYFVYPDWDCYSGSGQSVRFTLPDEPWNHIEMWGKAWGQLTLEDEQQPDFTFGVRTQNQVKSFHQLRQSHSGGTIRFDNALIEEPIGSFEVYNIEKGRAPEGVASETFILDPAVAEPENKALREIASFVRGRYPSDEHAMMIGLPDGHSKNLKKILNPGSSHPFIHIMIPYADHADSGLDGIEIKLPSLNVRPTH